MKQDVKLLRRMCDLMLFNFFHYHETQASPQHFESGLLLSLGENTDPILRCVIPVVLVRKQRIIVYYTHTAEHNYISPISTTGIQLHVSALYVGHLQVVI